MEEGKDYSLGHLRAKYLDMANMSFTTQQYLEAEGHIKSFMDTIKEDTEPAKELTKEFDIIEVRKHAQKKELMHHLEDKGELEKTDIKMQGELEIVIEALHDKKIVCWNVSQRHGLLYE